MADAKRQRRFQLSLRKMLLWMTVFAAWLSIVRLIDVGGFYAGIMTVWMGGLVLVRLKWGRLPGWGVATFVSAIALSVIFMVGALLEPPGNPRPDWFYEHLSLIAQLPMLLVAGGLAGMCLYFPVDVIVRVVNALDALLESKTPPAFDNPDSQPHPDAPSTEQ